jgi:hypothetical protein
MIIPFCWRNHLDKARQTHKYIFVWIAVYNCVIFFVLTDGLRRRTHAYMSAPDQYNVTKRASKYTSQLYLLWLLYFSLYVVCKLFYWAFAFFILLWCIVLVWARLVAHSRNTIRRVMGCARVKLGGVLKLGPG